MNSQLNMCDRAVILAGGLGTRLHPYTVTIPKPLVPVGEYPILEIIIRQLQKYGFKHITLAVNHQAELIRAFFGNGSKWNVNIDYSLEDVPLSTMGPLKLINDLPENFLVMNGDILTDLNFKEFASFHIKNNNTFTISSFKRDETVDYGVLEVDENHQLTGFREKPMLAYLVSMGIYMLNKKVTDYIPRDKAYGFDDLMRDLIQDNKPACIKMHDGNWLDIGRPSDYAVSVDSFSKNQELYI